MAFDILFGWTDGRTYRAADGRTNDHERDLCYIIRIPYIMGVEMGGSAGSSLPQNPRLGEGTRATAL